MVQILEQKQVRYRLYLDESGDHTSSHPEDVGKRYLGLIGTMFVTANGQRFIDDMDAFKRTHLVYDHDDPPILHREDILNKRGCYRVLCDDAKRTEFDAGLERLISNSAFKVVAVVLDKFAHNKATYRRLRHPYHYCLHGMLERYCGYLHHVGGCGDVMAESRGKTEDMALKLAYERVYRNGTQYLSKIIVQKTLTSHELKLKPKRANIAGLQLSDVLAHPLTRNVLAAYGRLERREDAYSVVIGRAVRLKYNRHLYTGKIKGYGMVIL